MTTTNKWAKMAKQLTIQEEKENLQEDLEAWAYQVLLIEDPKEDNRTAEEILMDFSQEVYGFRQESLYGYGLIVEGD